MLPLLFYCVAFLIILLASILKQVGQHPLCRQAAEFSVVGRNPVFITSYISMI